MARPRNTHSRRLAIMLKESEFENLQKLADQRGVFKAEVLRDLLNKEVARLKRNKQWGVVDDGEAETD